MNTARLILPLQCAFLLTFAAGAHASEPDWKPASAPLMTRFAKNVSPTNSRPEYPRPQAVRKEWMNLNGLWEFAFDDANRGRTEGWNTGKKLSQQILVPFTFEAALSGIGKGKEIHERVWYRHNFTVPEKWQDKRLMLHFGAVDWDTVVWVNGKEVGTHRGGYAPFSFDITEALKAGSSQEIVVAVYDPADPQKAGYQPKGKQLGSREIWYTRTTGIWQTVWVEPVSQEHIRSFQLDANPKTKTLTVSAEITGNQDAKEPMSLETVISGLGITQNAKIAVSSGSLGKPGIIIGHPDVQLWSPENPALYDVTLTLKRGKKIVDRIQSYCAFRSVGLENGRITLNGKPYFFRAVLDQGYWPDGILTPPTEAALKNDIAMTKALGFNMARKHVKVEEARWYYHCDKMGLLVAQDMPSSHNLSSEEAKTNFVQELKEVMASVRFHPCIVLWIPFNENWGDPKEFQDTVVDLTRSIDPSRPIIDASGWTQREKTDITDIHDYGNDLAKHSMAKPPRPRWIGEYGGVALPVTGHTWVQGWGYQTVNSPEALLDKYRFLTDQINEAPGLSGFCYTQLTDVEQELNGLLTYDRLPKAVPAKFAAINTGKKQTAAK